MVIYLFSVSLAALGLSAMAVALTGHLTGTLAGYGHLSIGLMGVQVFALAVIAFAVNVAAVRLGIAAKALRYAHVERLARDLHYPGERRAGRWRGTRVVFEADGRVTPVGRASFDSLAAYDEWLGLEE